MFLCMSDISMGAARRRGQVRGEDMGALVSLEMREVIFVLQMLSIVSVDEVFLHYFEKMLSTSGGCTPKPPPALCLWTPLGTSVLQTPSLPTSGKKNPAGAHICVSHKRIESNSIYSLCLGLLVTCVIVGNVFQYL